MGPPVGLPVGLCEPLWASMLLWAPVTDGEKQNTRQISTGSPRGLHGSPLVSTGPIDNVNKIQKSNDNFRCNCLAIGITFLFGVSHNICASFVKKTRLLLALKGSNSSRLEK